LVTFLDFRLSQGSVARYCRRDGTLCESPGERILKIGPLLPKLLSNIKGLTYFGTRCISTPPNRTGIWLDCKKNSPKIFATAFLRGCYAEGDISTKIQDMAIVTIEDE